METQLGLSEDGTPVSVEAVAEEFAALEAEGLVRKTGRFRKAEPVYIVTAKGQKHLESSNT
jgi:hypothetical protein